MKLPIIINEHGYIDVFEMVEDVCLKLEAVDVNNEEYVAYDSEGYVLKLETVVEKDNGFFGRTEREAVTLSDFGEKMP